MSDTDELLPEPLPEDPLAVTQAWLQAAFAAQWQPNPNAMVLATSTPEGRPSARVVLLRDIVPDPGYVQFYTNYLSMKGRQLKDNPHAAAVIQRGTRGRDEPTGPGDVRARRRQRPLLRRARPGAAHRRLGERAGAPVDSRAALLKSRPIPPRASAPCRAPTRRRRAGLRRRARRTGAATGCGRKRWS
jgi:hypothetical protein